MGNIISDRLQQRKPRLEKPVVMVGAALILPGLGGGGFWRASDHSLPLSNYPEVTISRAASRETAPAAVSQLRSFSVKLADADYTAFLQVAIAVGSARPFLGSAEKPKAEQKPTPSPPFRPREKSWGECAPAPLPSRCHLARGGI